VHRMTSRSLATASPKTLERNDMRRKLAAAIVASSVIGTLATPAVPVAAAPLDGCTRAEYSKLTVDMRKNRIERIVGFEGTLVYRYYLLRIKEFKFSQAANEPVCFVVLQQGQLTEKARKRIS